MIKKDTEKPIRKNIGRIFRKHNIIEYKGPEDYLSVDDFYKVYGYTCFYKADTAVADMIKIEELTISLVCHNCPRKLIKHLDEKGYKMRNVELGIYYIEGLLIPIQLILTSKLSKEENLWLRSLTNQLTEVETARRLLIEYEKHKQDIRYESVMNLITNANRRIFQEGDMAMCEALIEIAREKMQSEFEEVEHRGLEKGKIEGIQQMESLIQHLIAASRSDEIERAVTDREYQNQLLKEFGL